MRRNIVHSGADHLTYEIRGIVLVGKKLESMGITIRWENIGDPIQKGEHVPSWIKDIVADTSAKNDRAFAYSPTRGVDETRRYLARIRNALGGVQITDEDILFFNGLGDAIATVYTYLNAHARMIGPDPAYPTHSSAEAAHAGSAHLTYHLDPHQNWLPDLNDLYHKIKYNPSIVGMIIINPDNPTGMVYPRAILKQMVEFAREFDLFIISDEIYARLSYGTDPFIPLASILGDVPGIAMRGLSKEVPWPGSRSGWIEMYNRDHDSLFARYCQSIIDAKMLEVCSTTLPQMVIPQIFEDPRYAAHLALRNRAYAKRAQFAQKMFSRVQGIIAPMPQGAFYYSIVFEPGVLNTSQILPIQDSAVRAYIDALSENVSLDKRFAYYLMASTGICVVPLSGFNSALEGFRFTLLETDAEKFETLVRDLTRAITQYLSS